VLELADLEDESDTIGGYLVTRIGRLPRKGDRVEVGEWTATVESVLRRRIDRLRFEPLHEKRAAAER
jgi:CBS domain containing-hemolysin-like protein